MSENALRRVALIALACGSLPTFAQCTPRWLNGVGIPWIGGGVVDALTTWDPDGAGPEPTHLVVGGDFGVVEGSEVFGQIAAWNPVTGTWRGFNGQITGHVHSIVAMPNGDLVAGGRFWDAGGVPVSNVARWDGATWNPLGTGIGEGAELVYALAVLPNGDLVAGGNFYLPLADGTEARFIARWDGTEWHSIDSQMNSWVTSLLVTSNGTLVAGGNFDAAGGHSADRIALWSEDEWTSLGSGPNGIVYSITEMENGSLVAAGAFSEAGGVATPNIAVWDGTSWTSLGSGTNRRVDSVISVSGGHLIAGGHFQTANGSAAHYIARWDGSAWLPFGSGISGVGTVAGVFALVEMPNGDVFAGGSIPSAQGIAFKGLARWGEPLACLSNYNCDGLIDIIDFLDFLDDFSVCEQAISPCGSLGNADVNSDGIVDILDFLDFLDSYSLGC